MTGEQVAPEILTLTTAALPKGNRDEVIREYYGRIAQRLEIEPDEDAPFRIDVTALRLPGVMLGGGDISPMTGTRTAAMRADGVSDIVLTFQYQDTVFLDDGDVVSVRRGDAALTALHRPVTMVMAHPTNRFFTVQTTRETLSPLVRDLDGLGTRAVSMAQPGMRLLETYARHVTLESVSDPEVCDAVSRHLVELAALALGPSTDGREAAHAGGGVRAARLASAKAAVARSLESPRMTAAAVARSLGVSTRYLHMLFETEPLSFSEFVAEQRLLRAVKVLSDPAQRHRRILDIALQFGFGDVSTFNRAFRRRFGKTPSDFRPQ